MTRPLFPPSSGPVHALDGSVCLPCHLAQHAVVLREHGCGGVTVTPYAAGPVRRIACACPCRKRGEPTLVPASRSRSRAGRLPDLT